MAIDLKHNWPVVAGIAVIGAGGLMIAKARGSSGVATTIVSNPGAASVAQTSLGARQSQLADIESGLHDFLTAKVDEQKIQADAGVASQQIMIEPQIAQIAASAEIAAANAQAAAITSAAQAQAQAESNVAASQQKGQSQSSFWNSLGGIIGSIGAFFGL